MTTKKIKELREEAALLELGRKNKPELLRAGPRRYGPLRKRRKGSWRFIYSQNLPAAVLWTDWENGFDVIHVLPSRIQDRLENYVIQARALDIPAGWAYTTVEDFIKRFEKEDAVSLGPQQNGTLRGAVELAMGRPDKNKKAGEKSGTKE